MKTIEVAQRAFKVTFRHAPKDQGITLALIKRRCDATHLSMQKD
jgi:hypothetical protein